jgi:hypothetical protein
VWDPLYLNPEDLHACYGDIFTFLYVYDVRTSQETRVSTALTVVALHFLHILKFILILILHPILASTNQLNVEVMKISYVLYVLNTLQVYSNLIAIT